MKCICGYYHLEDWQIDLEDAVFQYDLRKDNGDSRFILLTDTMHIENGYGVKEVQLYVCPRCHTVKMV
jgi:hypothetical protein